MLARFFPELTQRLLADQYPSTHEFFNFTSGRWIVNEERRLRERRVWFDVEALKRVATRSVGAKRIISMQKIAEGKYNKAFLLRTDHGQELIARIPNSNVGQTQYVTASEVATMDYARNHLGLPLPRVLDWSTIMLKNAQPQSSVAAELSSKVTFCLGLEDYHPSGVNSWAKPRKNVGLKESFVQHRSRIGKQPNNTAFKPLKSKPPKHFNVQEPENRALTSDRLRDVSLELSLIRLCAWTVVYKGYLLCTVHTYHLLFNDLLPRFYLRST